MRALMPESAVRSSTAIMALAAALLIASLGDVCGLPDHVRFAPPSSGH
jgi:hypothetical protein